jgi:hypothetical protein
MTKEGGQERVRNPNFRAGEEPVQVSANSRDAEDKYLVLFFFTTLLYH